MDHISYIDQVLDLQQESYQEIPEFSLTIESVSYTISKQIKTDTYIGKDSATHYIIQILPYQENLEQPLRERESMIPIINGLSKTIQVLEDKFVILLKKAKRISLQDYFAYKKDPRIPRSLKDSTELCVDVIIKGLLQIISSVSSLEKNGFAPLSLDPKDIYIEITANPLHPIYLHESLGFELKIDTITNTTLESQKSNPLQGLALCIFSALKNKLCKQVNLESKRLKNPKNLQVFPFALSEVITSLLNPDAKAEEILFSSFISTWIFLFKDDYSIPQTGSFDIDALLVGLHFKNKSARIKSVFTMISQEKEALPELLKTKPCFSENSRKIIKSVCQVKNWQLFINYAKTTVKIFNELIDEKVPNEAGKLKLYKAIFMPEISVQVLNKICSSKTMTGPCILSSSRFLLEKVSQNREFCYKILPFMGFQTISYLSENGGLNPYEKIKVLSKTPINVRRLRIQDTFEIISKNTIKSEKYDFSKLIIKSLKIIREVIYDGRIAHDCNKAGKCYKNDRKLNVSVLMVYCSKCSMSMCLVCGSSHTDIHDIKHLKYVHSDDSCKKSGECFELQKDIFALNEIDLVFFDSSGNVAADGVFCTSSSEELSITTTDQITTIYDDTSHSTLLYYEVEIINAGFSENISIGVDGVGVFYTGHNGLIVNSLGQELKQAAKFGTGDTIGIGFTSSHFLYFTYNGFNLHLYTECPNVSEIRPLIKVKGKGIKIKVVTNNFTFCQATYLESVKNLDEQIKALERSISKCNGSQEDLNRISEILAGVPSFSVVKVPRVMNKSTPQKKMNACKDSCVVN